MDKWKYYDITHQHHTYLNPMLPEKFGRFINLLNLPKHKSVIDIACGNGEFLLSLAENYQISAVGVDLSPYFIAKARSQMQTRTPDSDLRFVELDGADFEPDQPNSFHLASCIGASWVFGGHGGTLDALIKLTEPGGWVVAGEPFWLKEPADDYLKAEGMSLSDIGTHYDNVKAGEERGLNLVHTFVSTHDEWDMYEGLKWFAADEYAQNHPEDPDLPELLDRVAKEKETYLKWGRESMGWAIYLFRQL